MTKKSGEHKVPITGRSAQDRRKARAVSAAGAERVEKKRQGAIDTRSKIVVGEIAVKLAPGRRALRQLIAAAMHSSAQPDVRAKLRDLSGGVEGLRSLLDFQPTWDLWEELRDLDRRIEKAWAGMELLLNKTPDAPDDVLDEVFAIIEAAVAEWEQLMGIEHPAGQLMRMTSRAGD